MTARNELQKAMYAKITGDTPIMAILQGVYDIGAVPDSKTFPYVTIGETTEADYSVLSRIGYEDTVTLHIWCLSGNDATTLGSKQCNMILSNLNRLFNHQSLTLDSQSHAGTWYEFSELLNDPGEKGVLHMPVRYRLLVQE